MKKILFMLTMMLTAAIMLPSAAMAVQMDVYSAIFGNGSVRLEKNGVAMRGGTFALKEGAPVGLSASGKKAVLYIMRESGKPLRILYGDVQNSAFDVRGTTDRFIIFAPFKTDYELEFSEDSVISSVVLQSGVDMNYYGQVGRLVVFSDSEVDIADTAQADDIFLRNERSSIRVDSTARVNTLHCVSKLQTAVIYNLNERD